MKKRRLVGIAILALVAIASLFLWPAPTPFASRNRVYLDWGIAWLPTEIKSFLSGELQTTVAGRPLIFVLNEREADYILAVRTLIVKSEAEFVTSGTNALHLVFSATERRTNRNIL
ncbi:MAG: hypothetical protein QXI12_09920 [Candidatus Methanomethyliaceae archaeon]